jgi:hypothetical protein
MDKKFGPKLKPTVPKGVSEDKLLPLDTVDIGVVVVAHVVGDVRISVHVFRSQTLHLRFFQILRGEIRKTLTVPILRSVFIVNSLTIGPRAHQNFTRGLHVKNNLADGHIGNRAMSSSFA